MHEFLQINFAFKSEDYARMLESQYADNINVIDVRQKSQIYDYMIIATMSSGRQRKAAANYIYLQVSVQHMYCITQTNRNTRERKDTS